MSEDLENEIEAINSIYGDGTLTATDFDAVYRLQISSIAFPLRLQFPADYPSAPPILLGSETSGTETRREDSRQVVELFKQCLGTLFEPGQVCLFDVIEDFSARIQDDARAEDDDEEESGQLDHGPERSPPEAAGDETRLIDTKPPPWILSDAVTELKSVFIAHAAPVTSPEEARRFLQHLLASDKKIRTATHNITAWRVKGVGGVTFQDCDDDGETAAGGRVLHLMQLMDIWNVMVVVTRWYGGHQLGPKRFSIINAVARDAFVKGNFVEDTSKKRGKR